MYLQDRSTLALLLNSPAPLTLLPGSVIAADGQSWLKGAAQTRETGTPGNMSEAGQCRAWQQMRDPRSCILYDASKVSQGMAFCTPYLYRLVCTEYSEQTIEEDRSGLEGVRVGKVPRSG